MPNNNSKWGYCTCPDCELPDEPTTLTWHPEGGPDYRGGWVCDGCKEALDDARTWEQENQETVRAWYGL